MAITFPYTFATQSGSVPASELDSNFQFCSLLAGSVPLAGSLTGTELILLYQGGSAVAQTIDSIAAVTGVGTATQANKLTTARTIASSGDVSWSVSFDGSGNVSSTATVASATSAVAGKVQLAQGSDVLTGTSTTLAVTPGALTANQSLASSGYAKLAGGLTLQWGVVSASEGTGGSVSFPVMFSSAVYSVTLTPYFSGTGGQYVPWIGASTATPPTTAGFSYAWSGWGGGGAGNACTIYWMAIGK